MKKPIALAFSLCIFLSACGSSPPSSSLPGSTATPASTEPQYTEQPYQFDYQISAFNPYNIRTATNKDYTYVVQDGVMLRAAQNEESFEVLPITMPDGEQLTNLSNVLTFEENIYFKNPMGIYRADADGQNVVRVVSIGSEFHLAKFDGLLIAYSYTGGDSTSASVDSVHLYVPNNETERLTEIYGHNYSDERVAEFEQRIYDAERGNVDMLRERLFPEFIETPFNNYIRTDDEYYILGLNGGIYRATLDPDTLEELPLTDEVAQRTSGNPRAMLVNYDAEWLYIRDEFSIYRIKRDGSEYENLVNNGVDTYYTIDVADGHVFYRGLDGNYYKDNSIIAEPAEDSPLARRITLNATVVETDTMTIVRPDKEEDTALLGERVSISTPNRVEVIDDNGVEMRVYELPVGARVTIIYEGTSPATDYTSLLNIYRIVYHND